MHEDDAQARQREENRERKKRIKINAHKNPPALSCRVPRGRVATHLNFQGCRFKVIPKQITALYGVIAPLRN